MKTTTSDLSQKLWPRSNRGSMTGAYMLILGLVGLVLTGLVITILDQLIMGELWNFNIRIQANGTILGMFSTMWALIAVAVTIAMVIGFIVEGFKLR